MFYFGQLSEFVDTELFSFISDTTQRSQFSLGQDAAWTDPAGPL